MSWGEAKWIVDQLTQSTGQAPNNMRAFNGLATAADTIALTFLEPADSYDAAGNLLCSVGGVMIRMSTDDFPQKPSDGTLVINNTDLGAYENTPYLVTGLTGDKTYYFTAFPYSKAGVYNISTDDVNQDNVPLVDGEVAVVTLSLSDKDYFNGATVKLVDETISEYTTTATLSNSKTTASFFIPTGDTYHIEYGKADNFVTPATTESKVAVASASSAYTAEYSPIYGISRTVTNSSVSWARTEAGSGKTATASVGTTAGASDFDFIYPWSEMERKTLDTGDVMVWIPEFYYRRYVENNVEYIQIAKAAGDGFVKHKGSGRYVGAYKTSSNNKSVSGAAATVNQTRATMRTNAKAKGTGWGLIDKLTESAIQMLFLVEFATYNAQAAIGRGYCDSHSAAINVGTCDSVANLTGRPAGTDGSTDVVYRGIEGFWGNIWEWVDGVNWYNGTYYVCDDPTKYADDTTTGYTKLSFTGSTSWSGSYITREGCDTDNPWAILPSAAGSGSESTYMSDGCWSADGWRVSARGGRWFDGSLCGLFTVALSSASSHFLSRVGSRLLYDPS